MCPQKLKIGDEQPTPATPPRVGPKTLANPRPTGVGKRGSKGLGPLAGGCGGCAPTIPKRGRVATPFNLATSGTQNVGEPSANGGGQTGGPGGGAPWQGVVGDVPPETENRGRAAHISNPATSGTQNVGEPSANGGGQTGGPGGEAPWQGVVGDVPFPT